MELRSSAMLGGTPWSTMLLKSRSNPKPLSTTLTGTPDVDRIFANFLPSPEFLIRCSNGPGQDVKIEGSRCF